MVLFCGMIDSGAIPYGRTPGFIISEENRCQRKTGVRGRKAEKCVPLRNRECMKMEITIREYKKEDAGAAAEIWNQVVEDGVAFPQMEMLDETSGDQFFSEQSYTGIAADAQTGEIVGLYILHPNNVGRCGHICNASYAVRRDMRGRHIGEKLVRHCMEKGREIGFRILQFNAVVSSNTNALRLYEKLGFVRLGTIPGGFLMKDGHYEDIIPHYHLL